MTGKVINLRSRKKALERADKARRGAANAAAHGRTKAERDADTAAKARAEALLDAHRRDDA